MTDFEQHSKPSSSGHVNLSDLSLWQDEGSAIIREGKFEPTDFILSMSFQGPDLNEPTWEGNLFHKSNGSAPELAPASPLAVVFSARER